MNVPKTIDDIPLVFGIAELCIILDISRNTALGIVNKPGFPKSKVGRKYIIAKTHFVEWLDSEMKKNNA